VALAPAHPVLVHAYIVAPEVNFASLDLDDAQPATVAAVLPMAHPAGTEDNAGQQALVPVRSTGCTASTYLRLPGQLFACLSPTNCTASTHWKPYVEEDWRAVVNTTQVVAPAVVGHMAAAAGVGIGAEVAVALALAVHIG
jgi:hypothetical protein